MKKLKFMLASMIPLAALPATVMSATDGSAETAKNNLKRVIDAYRQPVFSTTFMSNYLTSLYGQNSRAGLYIAKLTQDLLQKYQELIQNQENVDVTSTKVPEFVSLFGDVSATFSLLKKYHEITGDTDKLVEQLNKGEEAREQNKIFQSIQDSVTIVLSETISSLKEEDQKEAEKLLKSKEEEKAITDTFKKGLEFYKKNLVVAEVYKNKTKEHYTSALVGTYLDKLYEDLNTKFKALEDKNEDLSYISKNILDFVASFDSYMELLNLLQRYKVTANETELFNAEIENNKEKVGNDLAKMYLSIIQATAAATKKSKEMSADEIAKLMETIKEKETQITDLQNQIKERDERIKEFVGNTDQNALSNFNKAITFYKTQMLIFKEYKTKLKEFYTGQLISSYLDKLYDNVDTKFSALDKNKDNLKFISENILEFVALFDSFAEISNLLQRYKVTNNETEMLNAQLEKNKDKAGDDLDKITLSIIQATSESIKTQSSNDADKIKELEDKNKVLNDQIKKMLDKNNKPKKTKFGTTEIVLASVSSALLLSLIVTVAVLIKHKRRH